MRKNIIVLTIMVIASIGRASVVTNFFANFTGSVNGSATVANLNAGTAVGSWSVTIGSSFVSNGITACVSPYTNSAILAASVMSLSDESPVTINFDIRDKTGWNYITVKSATGNNIISLRIENNGVIDTYNINKWQYVASLLSPSGDLSDGQMNTISLVLRATNYTISVDGTLMTSLDYGNLATAQSLGSILFSAGSGGIWLDNLNVTTVPEPVTIGLYSLSGLFILLFRRVQHSK